MSFFDLNIPYETSQPSKTARIKLVVKAMELGYIGIAYNRTIKGVMSDRDRCCITRFSLSTLLNVAPSLSSSVHLHRDLLGVPRSSPFRQYSRLTVCADSPAQSQVLNSGNPVLKSYDLVAVRPLNQIAFDHACEKSEVDIIAIDLAEKLPFRLKLPMVKAAMERGICFEITYSDLIVDVQVRRQMISNAKLLVDWTRGRNLIFTSGAPSVNELRGPHDVANLSSLLGLSMERAKAAISKNCRNLIANALKKKQFYKEAIRVELISSDEKTYTEEPFSVSWLKWDPISSGKGNLQLEDVEKSFSDTTRVSNSVKTIDFASVINTMPSFGGNSLTASKAVKVCRAASGMPEKPGRDDILPETDKASPPKSQSFHCGSSPELQLPTDAAKTATICEKIGIHTSTAEEEAQNLNDSDVLIPLIVAQKHDLQSQKCISNCELNALLPSEGVICQRSAEIGLTVACVADTKQDILSENVNFVAPQIENSKNAEMSDAILDAQNVVGDKNKAEMGLKDQEDTPIAGSISCRESRDDILTLEAHVPFLLVSGDTKVKDVFPEADQETSEEVAMEEQEQVHVDADMQAPEEVGIVEQQQVHVDADLETPEEVTMEEQEHGNVDTDIVIDQDNDLKVKENSSVANFLPLEEVAVKELKNEEADSESNYSSLVSPLSGKSSAKQRTPRQPYLFPLKRLLNPISFKKKSKTFKQKRKVLQTPRPISKFFC